ncbi:hypothetical protein HMPREF9418_0100 [Neisseria macacae ATCC 33926]|uniref:Uncharacterized protein n=2 Tax=Neisseria TaxID=482 RepID=I2NE99_NEISI|nr:hypothetical protein HMPREF9418_0100 [Neisseria macacae ATCC 33926]EIG24160.1 hypothetical protein HMPREF1051_0500 [Neisseria sicca VK64]
MKKQYSIGYSQAPTICIAVLFQVAIFTIMNPLGYFSDDPQKDYL